MIQLTANEKKHLRKANGRPYLSFPKGNTSGADSLIDKGLLKPLGFVVGRYAEFQLTETGKTASKQLGGVKMTEARDRKVVVDQITEAFGDVLAERNVLRSELERTEKRLKTLEDAIGKAYCDTFVLCWINVPLDVAPSVFQNELMKQQAELTPLKAEIKQLRDAAESAELLRAKAKELSSIQDRLYDALWKTDNPTDRRTKAWKAASRAANIAWHDFNNALRNIGLDVCENNRKANQPIVYP